MIDGLRPYPEMKESGLPWLGAVPAHWDVRRLKTLLKEIDNRTTTGKERLLSLRMRQGLVDHIEAGGKPISSDALFGFKIIEPGQVVMNRMRAASGLFGVASVRGLVSPDYAVFEPNPDAYTSYLLYVFQLPSLAGVFRAESKGLGTGESGFLRLYTDRFLPIPVPYPPLDEQRLIVRFLDWHGCQTAKLIRIKKRLIALLNEQKQSIIYRAVTRGLDPNAKLKPSGIPWLGDVPAGWEVRRLKTFVTNVINQKTQRMDGEIYVALEHVESWSGRLIHRDYESPFDSQVKSFAPGDILFGKLRPYLAKVTRLDVGGVCVGELLVLRASDSVVDPAFLECRLRTRDFIDLVNSSTFGAKMPRADWGFIGNVQLAFPSAIKEQSAIISFIHAATGELTTAIERVAKEIALLQQYRTRLIADVITGKLDVRAVAASLSDAAGLEPIDEAEEEEDFDEEAMDEADTEGVAA